MQKTEVEKELREIRDNPEFESARWRTFSAIKASAEDAKTMANLLAKYPNAYHKTMVEKELGLQVDPDTVRITRR